MSVGAVYFIILEINKLRQSASLVIFSVIAFHFLVLTTTALTIADLVYSTQVDDAPRKDIKQAIDESK